MQPPYPPPGGNPPRRSNDTVVAVIVVALVLLAFVGSLFAGFAYYAGKRYTERVKEAQVERQREAAREVEREDRASDARSASASSVAANGSVTLDLGDEGSLTVPAGSTILGHDVNLQENQSHDYVVRLPMRSAPLLVFTTKPDGVTCQDSLQKGIDQTRALPPGAEKLFKVELVEKRQIGGSDVVYSEVASRSPAEVKSNAPFHAGVGILMCGKTALVNLTLRGEGAELTEVDRAALRDIAMTFRMP